MRYTVIGYYNDNGQSHATALEARNAAEAFARVANDAPTFGGDLVLVCALDTEHNVYSPCPDAAGADICAARDYPAEWEGADDEARELTDDEREQADAWGDPSDIVEAAYSIGAPVNAVRKYMRGDA